jgi:pimeloyl-ACP methyl ester carboxylesterase
MASNDTPWIRADSSGVLAVGRAAPSAIRLAAEQERVGAVALVSPIFDEEVPTVQTPVLGFYGRDDEVVGADDRRAAQELLSHGEWVIYGGVGHGLVDEAAADYRWDVAEDVIERSVSFFGGILPR